jgi:hypothetical protein
MTVVAGGNGELEARVDEAMRDLVGGTLEAHAAAAADSLAYQNADSGRARQQQYLDQVTALRRELDETSGPVVLSGSTLLVIEVVRDTATQAMHDLYSFVEEIAPTPSRLSEEAIAELRARSRVASACVEAVIACENGRGQV